MSSIVDSTTSSPADSIVSNTDRLPYGCPSQTHWPKIEKLEKLDDKLELIVIVGGSGFLGRHIIWNLADSILGLKLIRILDKHKPPAGFRLPDFFRGDVAIQFCRCDITDFNSIKNLFKGADAVIHAASLISIGNHFNGDHVFSVNVKGTENILKAMRLHNVQKIVYTSSSVCTRTWHCINDLDEKDAQKEIKKTLVFPLYARTKLAAEAVLLEEFRVNGTDVIILRPPGIYGEGDFIYIPTMVLTALNNFRVLVKMGLGTQPSIQRVYAGNCAWAHVCALKKLSSHKEKSLVSGEIFHVGDDSLNNSNEEFVEPFLHANSCTLSWFAVPYFLVYIGLVILQLILRFLNPFIKIKLPVNSSQLYVYCSTAVYNFDKSKDLLGYEPRFSYPISHKRSLQFYGALKKHKHYFSRYRKQANF